MPEAIAIFVVFFLVGVLLLAAWLHTRHASSRNPRQELEQLAQHLAWLEERARHADEHHWGDDMKQRSADELDRTRKRIAAIKARLDSAAVPPRRDA